MESPPSDPPSRGLAPGATLSRFRIRGSLGAGGMGEVYRAEDTRLGRQVALKILPEVWAGDRERVARFEREASALAALSHPSIATIHEVGQDGSVRFLVMELVEGATLGELIPAGGMPIERFFELVLPLADALAAAHRRGVVHRDIKPGNVMVTPEGRVKVLDFGLAKMPLPADDAQPDSRTLTGPDLTRAGELLGTPAYMAPEQLLGQPVDERTDLFALGCLCYELLTGVRPFSGESFAALASAVLRDAPRPPAEARAEIPPALDRAVLRCLEKDPARRFQSMPELATALEEARSQLVAAKAPGSPGGSKLPSVAVLPFLDMNRDPDSEFFSDGLTEEVINALAHLEGLRVTSRTSAFRFKERAVDIREIGRELEVDTLLEGSVRRHGSRLRVTAQLIDVADGFHLWSERYDRELEDVFELQDEVARAVADRLRGTLLAGQAEPPRKPTADLQAYDLYLKGRYQWERQTAEGFETAIRYFEEAKSADPRFPHPRAWLAVAHTYPVIYGHLRPTPDLVAAARAEAEAALALDDGLAEGHEALGLVLQYGYRDWEGTEREYQRAMALSPADATVVAWHAVFLARFAHRRDEAVAEARRAAEMDPTSFEALALGAYTLLMAGRADEAVESAQRATELYPGTPLSYAAAAMSLLEIGRPEAGVELLRKALAISPFEPSCSGTLVQSLAAAGQRDEAKEVLAALLARREEAYFPAFWIATGVLGLGEHEQAIEWLLRAWEDREPVLTFLSTLPESEPVREDPRVQDILGQMGLG